MKLLEISRTQPGHSGIAPLTPAVVTPDKSHARVEPQSLDARTAGPVGAGLAHTAPSIEAQGSLPQTSALDLLSSQSSAQKTDGPHRRGRTAALRVRDVKGEADSSTKRAFRPLVELSSALQEALAPFGIKR